MDYLNLIPRPQEVTVSEDIWFEAHRSICIKTNSTFSELIPLVTQELLSMELTVQDGPAETTIHFIQDATVAHQEGYMLEITKDTITVTAATKAGGFYALQTLKQLALSKEGKNLFPGCKINDYPQFSWRGLMLDCGRNFFPVSFICKLLDLAALHKLNIFHWHLTDDQGWRLPVEKYPLLTEIGGWRIDNRTKKFSGKVGGSYTEEEIKTVVRYAADRCITVVPEIDMPGHMSSLLASYPGFGCTGGPYAVEDAFGVFDDVLCMGNKDLFSLIEDIFDSVIKLFPGKYIHIGGDECPRTRWEKCPKCQKKIEELGLTSAGQLQPWFVSKLANMLESKGKIAIGWDEVLDDADNLPSQLMVQSWRGIEGGKKGAATGHRVIMSPSTNGCYLDYRNYPDPMEMGRQYDTTTVKNSYDFSAIPEGMTAEEAEYVVGGQGNMWTEEVYYGRIAEYLLFPRLSALSEALWLAPEKKSFDSFKTRLPEHKKRLRILDVLYYDGKLE